ncbi:MAG TPA: HEPN domain-containing protein [Methanomassiliicoccales archaeon]|nr:HEPN domain-containing protein [Methanomassiliicoccales archaeon]
MDIEDCLDRSIVKYTVPDPISSLKSLEQSRRHLADAEENLYIMRHRVVVLSCYAAMFHAAKAVLYRDGVDENRQEYIPIYLRSRYPQLMAKANVLDVLRRFSHVALFGLDAEAYEEDAIVSLEAAVDFVNSMEGILKG